MTSGHVLTGHRADVVCIAAGVEGSPLLVSGSDDRTVRVWDTRIHRSVRGLAGAPEAVTGVAFGPGANPTEVYAVSGTAVLVHDLRVDGVVVPQPSLKALNAATDEAAHVAISKDKAARFLAVCDDHGDVTILERATLQHFKRLQRAHGDTLATCATFRPNRPWELISGGMDGNVVAWDFSRGRRLWSVHVGDATAEPEQGAESMMVNPPFINDLDLAPDGRSVVVGLGNGTVAIVDLERETQGEIVWVGRPGGHTHAISACRFIGPTSVLSGGIDKRLILWSVSDPDKSDRLPSSTLLLNHKVNALAVCSTDIIAVACAGSPNVHLITRDFLDR